MIDVTSGEEACLVICYRVTDLPIPHVESAIEHCRDCGERVWISKRAGVPKAAPRVCTHCAERALAALGDDVTLMTTKAQLAEVNAYFRAERMKH